MCTFCFFMFVNKHFGCYVCCTSIFSYKCTVIYIFWYISALFSNMNADYFTLVSYNAGCRFSSRLSWLLMCSAFRSGVQFMLTKTQQPAVSWVLLVRFSLSDAIYYSTFPRTHLKFSKTVC